jgi:hypothetical protein
MGGPGIFPKRNWSVKRPGAAECPEISESPKTLDRDEIDAVINLFLLLDAWEKKEKLLECGKPFDNA